MLGEQHPYFADLRFSHGCPLRNEKEDLECVICRLEIGPDELTMTHTKSCKLSFHDECLNPWLESGNLTCPYDRETFSPTPGYTAEVARRREQEAVRRIQEYRESTRQAWDAYLVTICGSTGAWPLNMNRARVLLRFFLSRKYEHDTGVPRERHLQQLAAQLMQGRASLSQERAMRYANQRLQGEEWRHGFGQRPSEWAIEQVANDLEDQGLVRDWFEDTILVIRPGGPDIVLPIPSSPVGPLDESRS